ncbi:MAG TPA: YdcF family protein [Acidimicrobiales bacterium]
MGLLATLTGISLLGKIIRLILLVVVGILVYLGVTLVQVWLTGRHYDPRSAQAIVVMGAAQYDGVPSPDLAARLNEAELLWRDHLAPLVVVTGSKEPGDVYTEAEASARYLEAAGIPAGDISQVGGRDSWENMALASGVLLERGDRQVLVVTDRFHEDRSLAIATSVGLTGYPTPTTTSPVRGWSAVPYYLKEAVGVGLGRIIGFNHLSSVHSSLG